MCVVMFWLSALSLAYCWPDGKIGSGLADSASLLEWRYVISSTLFLKNEITESITFDNIKDWDPRVKRYLPEFIRKNDTKAKATSVVLDLGGIVPTAVAVFGFGPLKDMKGVDGVVLWLCTFVLSLVAGLFAACEGVDEAHEPFRPMSFSSGPSRRGCRACRRRRCR